MKWKTLEHNGILFPPEYAVQGIKIRIRGRQMSLTPIQEEMVYQWAKKKDTPYAQDEVFQKNFTADFAKELGSGFENISYSDIDFSEAYKLVDAEKDAKIKMTKEKKKALAAERKEMRERLKAKYGTAVMDGQEVEVANYMAEPPGIFIGRGAHPLRGKWKRRVGQKDVTLNLGDGARVPPGDWGEIVHEHDATWLAKWNDDLTNSRKYVWLADTSALKQERDRAKYDKAVDLAKKIGKIKSSIIKDMRSRDAGKRRIATVCYLIYRTAMRVGDEKDPDEADTVGATTLRKEHISITDGAIELDFLGKDSIRWQETIKVEGDDVQFQKNLRQLIADKKPEDEIFGNITSRHVNRYYSGIVAGLSAKVFRTYMASREVSKYLREHDRIESKSPAEKLYHAKIANLQAAKMCNHKRTIPKTFESALQKQYDRLEKAKGRETKTEKQEERKLQSIEKIKLQIDLKERTKDYNIGTSLRNYIDPRIFKSWSDEVNAEWEKLYTKALQKKFTWVKSERKKWKTVSKQY